VPVRLPPIHRPVRRGLWLRWAGILGLAGVSQAAVGVDLIVITDSANPIQATTPARVVELDLPARIEAELAVGLPADPSQAAATVRHRLREGGPRLQRKMAHAYEDVAEAWALGITKLPAVVIDHRYVVYGDPDVTSAVARIASFRSSRP
jgi:integrating conjugative element protein (TIGR03757 family)